MTTMSDTLTLDMSEIDYDLIEEPEATDTEAPVIRPRFAIDTEDKANWLLRAHLVLNAEEQQIERQAAARLADIRKRRASLKARFDLELEDWARSEMENRRVKGKTLKLLCGNISFRTVRGGLKLTDADSAIDHAKVLGAVQEIVTVKIDRDRYVQIAQDALHRTGELLPGIEMLPDRESMSIRFAEGERDGRD